MTNTTRINNPVYYEKQLLAAAYILMSVVGLVGNFTVLLAVLFSRKPRNSTNAFVANLAAADFLTCLGLPVLSLGILSDNIDQLIVSSSLCRVEGFLLVVCVGCSTNNLASIAFNRALITRKNRFVYKHCKGQKLAVMLGLNWIIPAAIAILPLISTIGDYGYDPVLSTCSFKPTEDGSKVFTQIMFLAYYPVQLVIICMSYTSIMIAVRTHLRKTNRINNETTVAAVYQPAALHIPNQPRPFLPQERWCGHSPCNRPRLASHTPIGANSHNHRIPPRQSRAVKRNGAVNCSLFLVVMAFTICFTPYSLCLAFVGNKSQKFLPFLGCLLSFSSCINPFIYTARHPDFKRVCRCILCCRLSKIPMKSAFLLWLIRR